MDDELRELWLAFVASLNVTEKEKEILFSLSHPRERP